MFRINIAFCQVSECFRLTIIPKPSLVIADFKSSKQGIACGYGTTTAAETRCLYKQDVVGHIIGCRSLKHLQNCGINLVLGFFFCPPFFLSFSFPCLFSILLSLFLSVFLSFFLSFFYQSFSLYIFHNFYLSFLIFSFFLIRETSPCNCDPSQHVII